MSDFKSLDLAHKYFVAKNLVVLNIAVDTIAELSHLPKQTVMKMMEGDAQKAMDNKGVASLEIFMQDLDKQVCQ